MTAFFPGHRHRTVLLLFLTIAFAANAYAQTTAASAATAAWTVKVNGDIHWQQITPAGAWGAEGCGRV